MTKSDHPFMMKILFTVIGLALGLTVHAQTALSLRLNTSPSALELLTGISTQMNERDFAISPDGSEIYYTVSVPRSSFQTIVVRRKISGDKWTQPEIASFAGQYSDLEPAFNSDGKTMYFSSNRPVSGTDIKDFDIWKVERTVNGWGTPVNLGPPVNTEADEFYPSVTRNGSLYFTAQYDKGLGKEDIYVSLFSNGSFTTPAVLDSAVNSRFYEFNAFVSPDERYILFTSYGRKDDKGGGDLYISTRSRDGSWSPARNLAALNSKQIDYCPYVSPDGNTLFLTSERHELPKTFVNHRATFEEVQGFYSNPLNGFGNIYRIDMHQVLKDLQN